VEGHRPSAGVGNRVGQKQRLDLGFGERSAMHALEQVDEDIGQNRRIGDHACDVRHHAERPLQLLKRRLGTFRRRFDRLDLKDRHLLAPG
jgi:hypothetical protein